MKYFLEKIFEDKNIFRFMLIYYNVHNKKISI